MEAQRQADLARERLRLDQQRVDQELAYQRAVLEQNQRQFDALMKASTRWYLMIPHPERPNALDIRLWIHASSHDAADTCQRSKDETRRLLLAHARDVKATPEATQTVMGVMNDARCIASNDPRLSKGFAP